MDNFSLFFFIFNLAHKSPLLDQLMIFGAQDLIFIIFGLVVIFFIKGGFRSKQAFFIFLPSLLLAYILMRIVRIYIQEPRPFVAFMITPLISHMPDLSFPSEHTLVSSTVFWSYFYTRSKLWGILALSVLWIGFSRIYVGVHYPLDILGGILIGLLSVQIVWMIKKRLLR